MWFFFFYCYCVHGLFFFFSSRRRHTRSTRDWSSDVCSSDLIERRTGSTMRRCTAAPGYRTRTARLRARAPAGRPAAALRSAASSDPQPTAASHRASRSSGLFPLVVDRFIVRPSRISSYVCEAAGILVKLDLAEDSDGPWAGFVGVATLKSRAALRLPS